MLMDETLSTWYSAIVKGKDFFSPKSINPFTCSFLTPRGSVGSTGLDSYLTVIRHGHSPFPYLFGFRIFSLLI